MSELDQCSSPTSAPAVEEDRPWKDYLYSPELSEDFNEISQKDIDRLNKMQYSIIGYPIAMFISLFTLKKATELIRIPEILRNPLHQPGANIERGKHFSRFMGKNVMLLACTSALIGGYAVYEVNKYYMYTKYRNLVSCYLDACERQFLRNLRDEGKSVDFTFKSNKIPASINNDALSV